MDSVNTAIDASPEEAGSGIDAPNPTVDIQSITKITMMCQALQEKMKQYYRADNSAQNRATRLNNISTALKGINLPGPDGTDYTIKPRPDPTGPGGIGCPSGEKLVDDYCMVTASSV